MTQDTIRQKIVIVAQDKDIALPLQAFFSEQNADVLIVRDMPTLDQAVRLFPDIILLESTFGDVDGLTIFRDLRSNPLSAHIPVIIITDYKDLDRQNELLAAGTDDVVNRPFDIDILALRVRNAIQRHRREGLTDSITGLPAGPLLAEKRQEAADQADWVELTLHITHFDAFRSRYDFMTGNEVLRYAASLLNEITQELSDQALVGCEKEAQFVAFVPAAQAEAFVETCEQRLLDGLHQFYTFMEREQGYVMIEDGSGGGARHSLMQLEIA